MSERVVVEVAAKRSFASALDWPGWARSGATETAAIEALLGHASRYARVVGRTDLPFRSPADASALEIVERVDGGSTTEFGAPGAVALADSDELSSADLERLVVLIRAAWDAFDAAAQAASGIELTTGPRGGGRELDKIVTHVREAEAGYLGMLGSRPPATDDDPSEAMAAIRAAFIETLTAVATGAEIPNPRRTKRPWPPRYAVRRAAWHVLDHAWEIEDRAGLAADGSGPPSD